MCVMNGIGCKTEIVILAGTEYILKKSLRDIRVKNQTSVSGDQRVCSVEECVSGGWYRTRGIKLVKAR